MLEKILKLKSEQKKDKKKSTYKIKAAVNRSSL